MLLAALLLHYKKTKGKIMKLNLSLLILKLEVSPNQLICNYATHLQSGEEVSSGCSYQTIKVTKGDKESRMQYQAVALA
jgi:hypothetical protein